jgi:hypothetical protein
MLILKEAIDQQKIIPYPAYDALAGVKFDIVFIKLRGNMKVSLGSSGIYAERTEIGGPRDYAQIGTKERNGLLITFPLEDIKNVTDGSKVVITLKNGDVISLAR